MMINNSLVRWHNYKKSWNITLTIIFSLLMSCVKHAINEKVISVKEFPITNSLTAKEIKIPPILLNPDNICIVDAYLIISQDRKDTMFNIFKLPECNYLLGFGNKGNGPNEFHLPFEHVTLGRVTSKKSSAFAVGNFITNIQYYNIEDILIRNYSPYKTVVLPPELNYFRSITYINDSLIFGAPSGADMHIFKYNNNKNSLEIFCNYSSKFPLLNESSKRELYGCSMTNKPDNTKIAVTYAHQGLFEIYQIDSGLTESIRYLDFPSLAENNRLKRNSTEWEFRPEQNYFSSFINSTDNYIYICVFNTKYSQAFNEEGPKSTFIPEIHVFDWKGNAIKRIKVNKFFTHFAVDIDDKFIYAIDFNIEDIIYRYQL